MSETDRQKQMIIDHLNSVFYGEAWHGAALLPTIRELDAEEAIRKNTEGHSVWGVALHCAYWKFAILRKLAVDGESPQFDRSPDDFPELPDPADADAFQADIAFLEAEHRALIDAIAAFPAGRLGDPAPDLPMDYAGMILGGACHDAYHAAHIRNLGA